MTALHFIDPKLYYWYFHIDSICGNNSQISYQFWKLRVTVLAENLRVAFFSLFQSYISHVFNLWGHSTLGVSTFIGSKEIH